MAFQADGFQHDAFQVSGGTTGSITQNLPSFISSALGEVELPPSEDITHVEFVMLLLSVRIRQRMPAFTQRIEVDVNDDALVLLLI